MRFLSFLLVIFHLWLALVQAAHAGSANVAVTVTGTGTTLELAKADATRQALQQTISQLVVVDREIGGNAVLRDRVLSTMNGYIEKFVVRREIKTGAEYSVTADVVVSASRIENFLGIVTSAGGAFDGSSLSAEQARRQAQAQADILQRKARGEIFDNVLRPVPSKALSIRTTGITLSNTESDILKITVEISYKPEFIKALTGSVEALSAVKCAPQPRRIFSPFPPPPGGPIIRLREVAIMYGSEDVCRASTNFQAGGPPGPPGGWPLGPPGGMMIPGPPGFNTGKQQPVACFGYTTTIQCYGLAPGDYCASCQLNRDGQRWEPFQIMGRFVDSSGKSADSGLCRARMYEPNELLPFVISRGGFNPWGGSLFAAIFDFESRQVEIEFSTKGVSLDRARHFVAMGALALPFTWSAPNAPRIITSLLEGAVDERSGCALLDEAVRMRQLIGFDDAVDILR